jgi:hypothetical protein
MHSEEKVVECCGVHSILKNVMVNGMNELISSASFRSLSTYLYKYGYWITLVRPQSHEIHFVQRMGIRIPRRYNQKITEQSFGRALHRQAIYIVSELVAML